MDPSKFNTYLKEVQALAIALEKNPDSLKNILALIENYRIEFIEEPFVDAVFLGEAAFYKKKYALALKYYLKAPKVPYFHFLCYRATAFIHFKSGEMEKAKSFAEKALQILRDPSLLLLIKQINGPDINEEKTPEIKNTSSPSHSATPAVASSILETEPDRPHDYKCDREYLLKVQKAHELLLEGLDYIKIDNLQNDSMTLKLYLLQEIEKKVLDLKLVSTKEESQQLAASVYDEVMGFGPIEPLLRDETITDIFINGPDTVYIERRGQVVKTSIKFLSNDHIFRLVQRVASKSGRHLDLATPYFDAQLPDGSRIHAIIPPVAIDGIKVSLRKYQFQKFHIQKLVDGGSLTETMAKLLQIAVQARFNIAICGGTGSGKTTLLNSLLASIRHGERIITIEDTPELEPSHHHAVRLLTRSPNPEGKGAVTQADLMINALRMRPDRVILGELRGAEAFNMLHAMNTGQDGSMVTLHASGTEEVVSRLMNMILMARYALSAESVRQQIANALDLIIYVARLVNGSRRILTISQISEQNNDIKIEDIFKYDIKKITQKELQGNFVQVDVAPTKRIMNKLITSGLLKDYEALFDKSNLVVEDMKK